MSEKSDADIPDDERLPPNEDWRAARGEYLDAVEGIRRGLAQAKKGLGQPVDEVFDSIECE